MTEVLIVGCGPVGSVCALILAQAGVEVTVTDRVEETPMDLRASTVHPPTLEMLDSIGLAEPLIAQGLKAPVYTFRDRASNETFRLDLGEIADRTCFPFRLQCEQYKLVNLAISQLRSLSNVSLQFGCTLRAVEQGADRVRATVECADGEKTIEARYMIAADGASSVVRRALDIGFDGFTYPEAYLCYSTLLPLEDHISGLSLVNYVSDPEEWLVLLRAPSAWRVLLPVDSEGDSDAYLGDAFKDGVFARLLSKDLPVETVHRTIYRIHQRVAERFVDGRICLAGDAAHVNSPIGGYGMNGGIHDAFNLCRKLLAILLDGGSPELLGQYDRQRRGVAHSFVQAQTMDNTKAMKEGWGTKRDSQRASMAEIVADPAKRRDALYKQAMFKSLDDEGAIA
ncbi:FAD-dependent oxidoreductase [Croceicoccus mobilis]|uniref:FAD-dependent oxidoreductase n=1 Tax=Croceicoccus mobilis TaxID=1703339 RepID=UPI00082ABE7C|nr:FAD-dependent monooxygenase [Croceicoccus mobilis]